MLNILQKLVNYKILILFLFFFNEFTLSILDETPPLSEYSILKIRKIQIIIFVLFFYLKFIYLNKNNTIIHNHSIKIIKKFSYFFVILIIFDQTLKFVGFGIDRHWYNEDIIRFKTPYDMFSNKPDNLDHNSDGFRGPSLSKNIDNSYYSIAFFGGSTGYTGDPPIPEILSNNLTKNNIKNIVFNFSSNSSNHNQHIHRLVKFINYKFDLILFYGGNNETIQYLQYDPRPGYPYNFYMTNDLSEFKIFLLKHSSLIGLLEKYTGLISGMKKEKNTLKDKSDEWYENIVRNYLNSIKQADLLTKNNIMPNRCGKTHFLAILQPVNPTNSQQQLLWEKIIDASKSLDNLVNYNDLADNINFYDNVHIDQLSKPLIANLMTKDIKKIYKNKC